MTIKEQLLQEIQSSSDNLLEQTLDFLRFLKAKEKENVKTDEDKQEFSKAVEREYPLSEKVREQINSWQQSLGLRAEDIKRIEQAIMAAKDREKRKKQEAEHQRRLQKYEQKVLSSIGQGISPSHMRRELKQLQQTLELTDSEVDSIETRILSQRHFDPNIPSQPQPTQAQSQPRRGGILSSKKARRSVLLGSTALGLVLMPSTGLGLLIILGGTVSVWIGSGAQREGAWGFGNNRWNGILLIVLICGVMACLLVSCGGVEGIVLLFGSIIYLTSIYYGRW